MTRKAQLTQDVLVALAAADRLPGWNNRSRDLQRFDLGDCRLYVVPFRRWAYRRQELQAAAWWQTHGGDSEEARAIAAGQNSPPSNLC